MSLASLVAERSLVVCVGPGGVGKTTVSAAIGMAGAKQGRKTLVLTIDPARRLADALGLHQLDDAIQSVPLASVGSDAPIRGTLDAAMVDTAQSYAALIERIAPDERTKTRILGNPVFHAVSRSMARSHAYVAMERLYDAMLNRHYDLVVLDTPPARNALDILDAPHQLARFLDGRFVEWFMPQTRERGLRERILAAGGDVAKKLLGMLTGDKLLNEIVEFLDAFASLREGFIQRAEQVDRILRAETSGFVLVSSASPASADDAAWLRHDLARRRVPIDAVIFNQSFVPLDPRRPLERRTQLSAGSLERAWQRLAPHFSEPRPSMDLLTSMRELRVQAASENARLQAIIAGVEAELEPGCKKVQIPRFEDEIRELESLAVLADALVAEPAKP